MKIFAISPHIFSPVIVFFLFQFVPNQGPALLNAAEAGAAKLDVKKCAHPQTTGAVDCGTYTVFENRAKKQGREIALNITILRALGANPEPDAVFVLAGGPGAGATMSARRYNEHPLREKRDIVLVDQRGTGKSNPLHCELPASDENIQGYLENVFELETFIECREALAEKADLTQYTTPIAVDDFDEVRAALGYEKVNLIGGSYGTRAALVYMRRHGEHVRTAILNGVAAVQNKNPLYHARDAQLALEEIFEDCQNDQSCQAAFPNLKEEFEAVLARLAERPARVKVTHPATGEEVEVLLSRDAFAEALRVMMYSTSASRTVPLLIRQAYEGDYSPFATSGVRRNRGIRGFLAMGLLLSVVCASDMPRISEEEIVTYTNGTFLGDGRVRSQKAVCEIWPSGEVAEDFGEPVNADNPTLLLSGVFDPVTQPEWGEITAKHLPNSLHLTAPAAHGVGGSCIQEIIIKFVESGSLTGLKTDCVDLMKAPPFRLPE